MLKLIVVAFVFAYLRIAEGGAQTKVLFVGEQPDYSFGSCVSMHSYIMRAETDNPGRTLTKGGLSVKFKG